MQCVIQTVCYSTNCPVRNIKQILLKFSHDIPRYCIILPTNFFGDRLSTASNILDYVHLRKKVQRISI